MTLNLFCLMIGKIVIEEIVCGGRNRELVIDVQGESGGEEEHHQEWLGHWLVRFCKILYYNSLELALKGESFRSERRNRLRPHLPLASCLWSQICSWHSRSVPIISCRKIISEIPFFRPAKGNFQPISRPACKA